MPGTLSEIALPTKTTVIEGDVVAAAVPEALGELVTLMEPDGVPLAVALSVGDTVLLVDPDDDGDTVFVEDALDEPVPL